MTDTLQAYYCNGFVNYNLKHRVPCGKLRIGKDWVIVDNPFNYKVMFEMCPFCINEDFKQVGLTSSELEKILSMSG